MKTFQSENCRFNLPFHNVPAVALGKEEIPEALGLGGADVVERLVHGHPLVGGGGHWLPVAGLVARLGSLHGGGWKDISQ